MNKNKSAVWWMSVLLLVCLVGTAQGTTMTAIDDNVLREDSADNNAGTKVDWFVGIPNPPYRRNMLIRFDLTNVPTPLEGPGMYYVVSSATFNYYNAVNLDVSITWELGVAPIKPANGAWVEGTGNGSAPVAGASCWNYLAYNTTSWAGSAGCSTAGTDYGDIMGTQTVPANQPAGWYSITLNAAGLTAAIKEWMTGDNEGVILFHCGVETSGKTVPNTSEVGGKEPYIDATFVLVPEPASMALLALGGVLVALRRRRA